MHNDQKQFISNNDNNVTTIFDWHPTSRLCPQIPFWQTAQHHVQSSWTILLQPVLLWLDDPYHRAVKVDLVDELHLSCSTIPDKPSVY